MDILRVAVVVPLLFGAGCSSDGHFDFAFTLAAPAGHSIFTGNTHSLLDEANRAKGVTEAGPDIFAQLSRANFTKIADAAVNPTPVFSSDGKLVAFALEDGGDISLVNVADAGAKGTVQLDGNPRLLALAEAGNRLAYSNGTGPFTVHINDLEGKDVDAGAIDTFIAAYAGSTLYIADSTDGLSRIADDGTRTAVAGITGVVQLIGEPRGNRLWGIAAGETGGVVFRVDDGGVEAIRGEGPLTQFAQALAVAPGGKLVLRGGLGGHFGVVTGDGGADAREVEEAADGYGPLPIAAAPDATAVVGGACGEDGKCALGWKRTEVFDDNSEGGVETGDGGQNGFPVGQVVTRN